MLAVLWRVASVPGTALGIFSFLMQIQPTSSTSYLPHLFNRYFNPIYTYRTVRKRGTECCLPRSQGRKLIQEFPSFLMEDTSHQTIRVCWGNLVPCCRNSTVLWWTLMVYESEVQEGEWPSSLVSRFPFWEGKLLGTCLCFNTCLIIHRRGDGARLPVWQWWAMQIWVHVAAGRWGNCSSGAHVLVEYFYATASGKEIFNTRNLTQLSLQLLRILGKKRVKVGLHIGLCGGGGGHLTFVKDT